MLGKESEERRPSRTVSVKKGSASGEKGEGTKRSRRKALTVILGGCQPHPGTFFFRRRRN